MSGHRALDMDAILACADLIGRSGAKNLEMGFVHDDVPIEEAGWYATATYKGAKLIEGDHRSQEAACDALSRRMLRGALCAGCGQLVTLNDETDGCRWTRVGKAWERACGPLSERRGAKVHGGGPNRAQRRKRK